jgi:hypothetical protein
VDAESDPPAQEDEVLSVCPAEVLLAALIAAQYLGTYTDTKTKIAKHRELALDWLDWAVCESDMGRELMEAKAQAAASRRGDGTIKIGKV